MGEEENGNQNCHEIFNFLYNFYKWQKKKRHLPCIIPCVPPSFRHEFLKKTEKAKKSWKFVYILSKQYRFFLTKKFEILILAKFVKMKWDLLSKNVNKLSRIFFFVCNFFNIFCNKLTNFFFFFKNSKFWFQGFQ